MEKTQEMKTKSETRYILTRGAVVALVSVVILGAFGLAAFTEAMTPEVTLTVANTTIIRSTTFNSTVYSTQTVNFTQYVVRTEVHYSTLNFSLPATVQVSGNVSTRTPGTSPTQIDFVGPEGRITSVPVQGGGFTATLPNQMSYNVWVNFTTVVAGIGNGRCLAGALVLYNMADALATTWSC